MSLLYNATFDKNTRKLSFEDKAGNEIYSFTVPERGPAVDDITKPLTFKATQNGSTVKLTKNGSPVGEFQTSRDGGKTWGDYPIGTAIPINTGDKVSFRAKADRTTDQNADDYFQFEMAGKIEAWHNVMSMSRTNDFNVQEISIAFAFNRMFNGCTSLVKAPVLPATTLADQCYRDMFNGCTSLIKAPELPATTLTDYCYAGMFNGCTSLIKAPELPATTLTDYCYFWMFSDCTSLVKAPELPATTLTTYCYHSMFYGCTSLKKAPELPATTLAANCYQHMFSGCRSLNEVRCQMPSTISTEDIPTYTGTDSFAWLYSVSPTGTFYTNYDANWPSGASGIPTGWTRVNEGGPAVDDIAKPLTFKATQDGSTVKLTQSGNPSGAFQTSSDSGANWVDYTIGEVIRLNIGDEVSFRAKSARTSGQTQTDYFYFEMTGEIEAWHNVMSLYRTSDFAKHFPASYAFYSLFYGCTSLTKAPVLSTTRLALGCYAYMFFGCTSLTKAPELPATTLINHCYMSMFSGCQSLKEVRIAATKTASRSLEEWLYGVSATGDLYCDPNATIFPTDSASGIPANWSRHALADYPTNP